MDTREIVATSETPAAAPVATAETASPTETKIEAPAIELPAAVVPPKIPAASAAPAAVAAPGPKLEAPVAVPEPKLETADIKVEDETSATVVELPAPRSNVRRYALLAASLTMAIALGGLAGAVATVHFAPAAPQKPTPQLATAEQTNALKASVAHISRELAGIKTSVDAITRSTATQVRAINERLDRVEKAQVEPAAKLAKITESLDRLERKVAAAPAPAAAPVPVPLAKPVDVTGSVSSIEKHPAKPPTLDGWRVVDVYANRAVLQSRAGAFYEIAPGSNLPGVGRIEQIKREDGRIVVVTPKGIITAELTPQRRQPQQYYGPYRY